MKPPGIGEAISKGLEAAKPHYVTLIIGALIAMVIPLVCWPGFHLMCLKAVRGQKPEIGDAFIAFKEGLVDHIIMMILQFCCCIITAPLFFQGSHLILDKKMKWKDAMNKCLAEIKPNLVGWIIWWLVISIVGGICYCLTMPIGYCAYAYAYEKTLKGSA